MKGLSVRLLTLTLILTMTLSPLCARAETTIEPAMTSATFSVTRCSVDGTELDFPLTVHLGGGADPENARAIVMLGFTAGENELTATAAIEDSMVKAAVSGMDTGVAMPLDGAAKALVSEYLLMGMDYDEVSEEVRAAADEYLRLLSETYLSTGVASDAELLDTLYPMDTWIEEHNSYPALLNAVPAGEEEITLFGETYLAKKYTYSLDHATSEEYDAFYSAYDEHYFGASDDLDAAYSSLYNLVYEEWEKTSSAAESSAPASGGSLSEWTDETQDALSEAELEEQIRYSMTGTIWQVDEILATLDECTATTHYPDADHTTVSTYSDMRTATVVRIESSYDTSLSDSSAYSDRGSDLTAIQVTEDGGIIMEHYAESACTFSDGYAASAAANTLLSVSGNHASLDARTTQSFADGSDYDESEGMTLHADLTFTPDGDSEIYGSIDGDIQAGVSMLGSTVDLSMDLHMQTSPMPPVGCELMPTPPNSINPLEADDDVVSAFIQELEALLMQAVGSLIPEPETPSSVGGALVS